MFHSGVVVLYLFVFVFVFFLYFFALFGTFVLLNVPFRRCCCNSMGHSTRSFEVMHWNVINCRELRSILEFFRVSSTFFVIMATWKFAKDGFQTGKFAKRVIFSSQMIIQLLLFVLFSLLFALPAIRTYQKREVGFV